MRSVLVCAGAPARMIADQRLPPHHQPASAPAAAAAAGLLSRAAYRLAGFGGLLDARGRAQLAALAGFGVMVGGSPISHHHQHPHYRPAHHQQLAPLPNSAVHRQFLHPAPLFTPADLHLVLYGYARSRSDDEQQNATSGGAHSLSGLRINELSYGTLLSFNEQPKFSPKPFPPIFLNGSMGGCRSFSRQGEIALQLLRTMTFLRVE